MKTAYPVLLLMPLVALLLSAGTLSLKGTQQIARYNPSGFYYLNLDGRDGQVSR